MNMNINTKIIVFCNRWIELFSNKNTLFYQLTDDRSFADDCFSFGWEMDCGKSFFQKHLCENFDEALHCIEQENNLDLLGSLLFSHWRYFNHWAYSGAEILEHRGWFVAVLKRIKAIISEK